MTEYTPTVEEVREEWATAPRRDRNARYAEFDRMIAAVERAAAVKALREAAFCADSAGHLTSGQAALQCFELADEFRSRANRIESEEQA